MKYQIKSRWQFDQICFIHKIKFLLRHESSSWLGKQRSTWKAEMKPDLIKLLTKFQLRTEKLCLFRYSRLFIKFLFIELTPPVNFVRSLATPSAFNWFTNIDIIIAHSFIDFRNFFSPFHPLYCSSIFNNSINHLNLSHQFTFSPSNFRLVTDSVHGVRGDVNKPMKDILRDDQVPLKTAESAKHSFESSLFPLERLLRNWVHWIHFIFSYSGQKKLFRKKFFGIKKGPSVI